MCGRGRSRIRRSPVEEEQHELGVRSVEITHKTNRGQLAASSSTGEPSATG
jgi:hypothetical protein